VLKRYFESQDNLTYRFYFSNWNNNPNTLTTLIFEYNFPKDFKPALKEIFDKVNELRSAYPTEREINES